VCVCGMCVCVCGMCVCVCGMCACVFICVCMSECERAHWNTMLRDCLWRAHVILHVQVQVPFTSKNGKTPIQTFLKVPCALPPIPTPTPVLTGKPRAPLPSFLSSTEGVAPATADTGGGTARLLGTCVCVRVCVRVCVCHERMRMEFRTPQRQSKRAARRRQSTPTWHLQSRQMCISL